MTKSEVLSYLEKRLEILNKQEREDILAEVSQHIENKMQAGLTEEEAIEDFGNVGEFADEILAAYKVNPEYQQKKFNFEYWVTRFLKKFGKVVNAIADEITRMSRREIFSVLFKFCIVVLCLGIARFPIEMIANLLYSITNVFPGFIESFLNGIIGLCINIVFIVIVCYTLYLFVKKVFLPEYDIEAELDREYEEHSSSPKAGIAEKKFKKAASGFGKRRKRKEREGDMSGYREDDPARDSVMVPVGGVVTEDSAEHVVDIDVSAAGGDGGQEAVSDDSVLDDIKDRFKRQAEGKQAKEKRQRRERQSDFGFGSFLGAIFGFCLKVIVTLLMIPVVVFGLGVIVCFGILVALMFQGLPVIGLTIATLGGILCTAAFTVGVYKLIFKGGAGQC